jgi:prepilin-type processing-associated H-X9-DG protein
VMVLPFAEQSNLQSSFDLTQSVLQQTGNPQAEPLSFMLCPSDGGQQRYFADSTLTQGRRFAKGNYAAWCSPYHVENQRSYRGALIGPEPQKLSQITDGTSHSLLISEIRARENDQDSRGAWALPWTGASLLAYDMHSIGGGGTFVPNPAQARIWCHVPNSQDFGDTLVLCPDPAAAQFEKMPCINNPGYGSAGPRSLHPAGTQTVFLDGHVALLSNNIDHIAMSLLVSVNDGKSVDHD